jgi:hypothetical protein
MPCSSRAPASDAAVVIPTTLPRLAAARTPRCPDHPDGRNVPDGSDGRAALRATTGGDPPPAAHAERARADIGAALGVGDPQGIDRRRSVSRSIAVTMLWGWHSRSGAGIHVRGPASTETGQSPYSRRAPRRCHPTGVGDRAAAHDPHPRTAQRGGIAVRGHFPILSTHRGATPIAAPDHPDSRICGPSRLDCRLPEPGLESQVQPGEGVEAPRAGPGWHAIRTESSVVCLSESGIRTAAACQGEPAWSEPARIPLKSGILRPEVTMKKPGLSGSRSRSVEAHGERARATGA